jgi:predicted DNA-binding protein
MKNKVSTSFTISKELLEKLNNFSKQESVNKSALVEKLIKKFFEENQK